MRRIFPLLTVIGSLTLGALPVLADDRYFRPEAGGGNPQSNQTYDWNTTSAVWYDAAAGGTATTWNNGDPAVAYIPLTAGSFVIRLTEDISVAGFRRTGGEPPTNSPVTITSSDPGSPFTLTFSEGTGVDFNLGTNRFVIFENLKISGGFVVQGRGFTLGNGLVFENSTITNKGTIALNGTTSASIVMETGSELMLNVPAAMSVARLSGVGSITRSGPGSGGSFTLDQSDNTTFTGRFAASNVNFTKQGVGTFIMNGGGNHAFNRIIAVNAGGFYTDGSIGSAVTSFTVAGGATLGGTFTSEETVVLSAANSVLSPGMATLDGNGNVLNHAGTLVLAAGLSAPNGATFDFFLGEDDGNGGLLNSRIDITGGTVTLGGTKTVNLFDLGGGLLEDGIAYILFDASQAGTLAPGWDENWVLGQNTTGRDVAFLGFVDNKLQVVFAIPEPGTGVLLVAGLTGLLALGSRRSVRR
jgi:PEP-CTERM motif.